jgi:hypothetical protein
MRSVSDVAFDIGKWDFSAGALMSAATEKCNRARELRALAKLVRELGLEKSGDVQGFDFEVRAIELEHDADDLEREAVTLLVFLDRHLDPHDKSP